MSLSAELLAMVVGASADPNEYSTDLPSVGDLNALHTIYPRELTAPPPTPAQAHFANGYLPSFLRRLYRTPLDVSTASEALNSFLEILGHVVEGPDFARFVRENPEEADEFWLVHIERLSFIPPAFSRTQTGPDPTANRGFTRRHLAWNVHCLHLLFVNISLHLPATFRPLSSFPAETHKRLLEITPGFMDVRAKTGAMSKSHMYLPLTLRLDSLIRLILTWPDTEREKVKAIEEGGWTHTPWLDCDAHKERVATLTGCTTMVIGQELLKCSRCKIVRYCSKEHQLARWKAH